MLSDEELYRQLARGNLACFDELYRRYERRLFGFILTQLKDRAEAEDVFHEAFMAVLRKPRPGEMDNFRAWIFQVARHLCLNRVRNRHRAARALAKVDGAEGAFLETSEAVAATHPAGLAFVEEAPDALRRAVTALPEPLAQVYELRAAGHSYEQMAGILGVPLGTVKSRMNEMVGRLKKEMLPWTAK